MPSNTHFKKIAEERTLERKTARKTSVSISLDDAMDLRENNIKNVGYSVLKELYRQLGIDKFWKQRLKNTSIKYDLEAVFRLLVFSRILYPVSKLETFHAKDTYFEKMEGFSEKDVYRALDIFDRYDEELQKWIFDHFSNICKRDMSISYFDCTNYYFDIGKPDMDTFDDDGNPVDKKGSPAEIKYRKRGPEKNHRPNPIVEMGLLMDKNGIPLAFDLFPRNESEKVHMRPIINRVKNGFENGHIIFVADRGLNTSDNIYFLNGDNKGDYNPRDGYVYGQSVRGADAEFKAWVLSGGYKTEKIMDEDGNEITFTHKSRIHPKTIHVNLTVLGQKKKKKKMLPSTRSRCAFDKTTGEIVEGRELALDMEKISEEEKYDGYYSIVTSELNMSDYEIKDTCRGLRG